MANDHAVAVDLMNRYSSQSSDNQRMMNYWTQPPTVVVRGGRSGGLPRSAGSSLSRPRSGRAVARVSVPLSPQQVHRPALPARRGARRRPSSVPEAAGAASPTSRWRAQPVVGRFAFDAAGAPRQETDRRQVGPDLRSTPGSVLRHPRRPAVTPRPAPFPSAEARPARRAHRTGSRATDPGAPAPDAEYRWSATACERSCLAPPPPPGSEPSGRTASSPPSRRTSGEVPPRTAGTPPAGRRAVSPPDEARRRRATAFSRWAEPEPSGPSTRSTGEPPTSSTTRTRSPTTAGSLHP